jgi:competence ComEA-like helix-hairpin-helix protein
VLLELQSFSKAVIITSVINVSETITDSAEVFTMKKILKLGITLLVLYFVARALAEYFRPTRVRLDEYDATVPPDHRRQPPPPTPQAPTTRPAAPSDRVHLNEADAAALASLPRIGPALADRIVNHRNEFGSFGSLDELTKVRGIGSNLVERLRPLVAIS